MTSPSITEINGAIMHGEFNIIELQSIMSAIQFRQAALRADAKRNLKPGMKVQWYSIKRRTNMIGILQKVATKNATVQVGNTLWTVGASMLEAA